MLPTPGGRGRGHRCLGGDQSVYAPYTQWPKRFPLLQRGVLAAAERPGALLEVLENL